MDDINQHIYDYLDYYTRLDRPIFALMISGAWGAGKTWLVRDYSRRLKETDYVYISVYGARSGDEIAQRIFVATHPILASKGVAIAGRLIQGLLKLNIPVDFAGDSRVDFSAMPSLPSVDDAAEIAKSKMRFLGKTIILDDLERCTAAPHEIWGFVNRLLEQDGARVILLANEEKIGDLKHGETKEKNVGMTLRVLPDVRRALPEFLTTENDELLLGRERQIAEIVRVSSCENLRVLRLAIRDLARLLRALSEALRSNVDVIEFVSATAIAFAIEVYSGNVTPGSLTKLAMARYFSRRDSKDDDDADDTKLRNAFAKYVGVLEIGHVPPSLRWWSEFFERGFINRIALNAALAERFDETDKRPDWLRITALSSLEDAEFARLLEQTWVGLESVTYRRVGEILHVAGIQLWASSNGLSARSASQVVEAAGRALATLENDEFFADYRFGWGDEHFEAHAGVRYASAETADFQAILDVARRIQKDSLKALVTLKARELIPALKQSGAEGFAAVIESDTDGRTEIEKAVLRQPLLSEVDHQEFADALLDLPAAALRPVLSVIYRRLKARVADEERTWVKRVASAVGTGPGLRRLIAGRYLETLED